MSKKKIILFYIQLMSIFTIYGQSPESPNLCLVTVRADSLVNLKWHYEDTTKIDGYIIKRIIHNGDGVVEGTLNNIEILANNTITTYTDTSTNYSTQSIPYLRSEKYAINSYLIRNDSMIFSNMTLLQNTIFLSSTWDTCSQTAYFKWNKYTNRQVKNYQLFFSVDNHKFIHYKNFSSDDTTFSTQEFIPNTNYYFKIIAVLDENSSCFADTSCSNTTNFYSFKSIVPKELSILNVSTIDNNLIEINLKTDTCQGIKQFYIYRDDTIISHFPPERLLYLIKDKTDAFKIHNYYISSVDLCDKTLKESTINNNILLKAEQDDREFALNWTETKINNQEVDFYDVTVNFGTGWQHIKQLNSSIMSCRLSLGDIFGKTSYNIDNYSNIQFRISAQPKNRQSVSLISLSNTIALIPNGIIVTPNAFNPLSSKQSNRFFQIKTVFVKDLEVNIFNKAGAMIYKSKSQSEMWNGRNKSGKLLPQGAYIYHIKYCTNNGQTTVKKGTVYLVY